MKATLKKIALGLALGALTLTAQAQVASRNVLTLEGARKVAAAAEAEARRNNAGGAIAVVDDGGYLITLIRIDNTFAAASRVATGKARTSATFKKPTSAFEKTVNDGRFTMTALEDFTPLQGGVPIMVDGQIVGAIGVSGTASAQQDEDVAIAGTRALVAEVAAPSGAQPETGKSAEVKAAAKERTLVNVDKNGLALEGYDPVAYFTDGKPVMGDAKFKSVYRTATYHFASKEHKDLFDKEPAKYEPQFGAYCGYAASINRISPTDPNFWQILDGRLVLQHNQRALDLWNKDVPGNLVKADKNWPGLVQDRGKGGKTLVYTNKEGVALDGHDAVSYFTEGKPLVGEQVYSTYYQGATYYFANRENKNAFESEPAKYLPAYGGHCGYAASINKIAPADYSVFQIVDGRLILQKNKDAYALFNEDLTGNVAKADKYWPGLVEKKGK